MPMSNNKFIWRPNDNSSLTNMRYNLEASKWVEAVNSAEKRLPAGNYGADLGFIGALIQLPLLLIFFIFMIPIQIAKSVFKYNIHVFPGDPETGPILSDMEKFRARMDYLDKKYPPKKKRKKTWEDLTEEQREIVKMVRAETAKAKARASKIKTIQ